MLGFFIQPQVIREYSKDLTKLPYHDKSIRLPDTEIFIGDSTAAVMMMHLTENEVFTQHTNTFYDGVITFYQSFIQKQLNKFDFKSRLLHTLSCLDPDMSPYCQVLLMKLRKYHLTVKLLARELACDVDVTTEPDAVKFWLKLYNMQSSMGA